MTTLLRARGQGVPAVRFTGVSGARSDGRANPASGEPGQLDRDVHARGRGAGVDAADRLDVVVVAAGGEHDVAVVGLEGAGHVEGVPAVVPPLDPRVRRAGD